MNKKCPGCGGEIGFEQELCERCFKLKHYNQTSLVGLDQNMIELIINELKPNDLVLYVVDILTFLIDEKLINQIKNKCNLKLVLTKIDVLPKSVKLNKLKERILEDVDLDLIFVSSHKKISLDQLYNKINQHQKVYLIGETNAGKSSLINQLVKSYSNKHYEITTSHYHNTTLDKITIKLNDEVILIDTPGLNSYSVIDHKYSYIKKEIKPTVFQVKSPIGIVVDDLIRIDILSSNNVIFYVNNQLLLQRINQQSNLVLTDYESYDLNITESSDVVIPTVGFIKVTKPGSIKLFLKPGLTYFIRKTLI